MNNTEEVLKDRDKVIELLEEYSLFLEMRGYTDSDWRTEEPLAIFEFLKQLNKKSSAIQKGYM